MKNILLLFFSFAFITAVVAQAPVNDDCAGLVELGTVPACDGSIYTNIDATASDIGFDNAPTCFNGAGTQNDVWFSFVVPTDIVDISVLVSGTPDGPNGEALVNPQIAIYRGVCEVDGLAELACVSAPNGATTAQVDLLGLTPGLTYFVRINDYSASAAPNWGDFTVCVDEYVPAINIGDSPGTTACFGTLYDSGGPDGDYGNNENETFTICPTDPHSCILVDIVSFGLEFGFPGEFLNFYAGEDINAPLITSITGGSNGNDFTVEATSNCLTIQFTSDAFTVLEGFELTWQCSPIACDGSSVANPTDIGSIPFVGTGQTTCGEASTFSQTPCFNDAFLQGPEVVYVYNSPGGLCASIELTNQPAGTGILVMNGPPDDPETLCIAQGLNGFIPAANFQTAGTYYIVVANGGGCVNYDITIAETECPLSAALIDVLCNPLNGCIEVSGLPSIFNFEDGFQDIEIQDGVNEGCWLGVGIEPDFYWFTIEAQANGPFGFVLESAGAPSDIDFNVWGPFDNEEVCDDPAAIVHFIENNQPVRSSWSAGADPTGLADIHPVLNTPVLDEYDCGANPGAAGDDFVRTIDAQVGEVYVVLVNDFGNQVAESGISIDWSPSDPDVLNPIGVQVVGQDTALCAGQSVDLSVISSVNSIEWIDTSGTLSCTDCPSPTATPNFTTTYTVVAEAVCYTDTSEVTVQVFNVDAGPDGTVCIGEEFEIESGADYDFATYNWSAPAGVNLSCTDCATPLVVAAAAGTYTIEVTLTGPVCSVSDAMTLTVLPGTAASFDIAEDQQLCAGDVLGIGGPAVTGNTYSWTSNPAGFTSTASNPMVNPSEDITYIVSVSNGSCPVPSVDSVEIDVIPLPVTSSIGDTFVCQDDSIQLSSLLPEADVTYNWSGPATITDSSDPNTFVMPTANGVYTLTAMRESCTVEEVVNVEFRAIEIEVLLDDTVRVCKGDELDIPTNATPASGTFNWVPDNGSLNSTSIEDVVATPAVNATYIVELSIPGCMRFDSVHVVVDSLPFNLQSMPLDTTICQGELVTLESPIYEPSDFPNIDFTWEPASGQLTPDSLFNIVVSPDDTTTYFRISESGICRDTTYSTVNVNPVIDLAIDPANAVVCENTPVSFTLVSEQGDINQLEEIMWTGGNLSCMDCLDPTANPAGGGYSVEATYNGCPVGASATIQAVSLPTIILPTPEVCVGQSVNLNPDGIPAGVSYSWSSSTDPTFVTDEASPTVTPLTAGTNDYVLTIEVDGCPAESFTATVTAVNPPTLTVTEDFTICEGGTAVISASSEPSIDSATFEWMSTVGDFTGPTINVEELSTTTAFNLVYSLDGCFSLEESVLVTVEEIVDVVSVTASADTIRQGQSVTLTATTNPENPGNVTYTWLNEDNEVIEVTTEPTITVTPTETEEVEFSVFVTTAQGCTSDAENVVIFVEPAGSAIPNIFTPNGDGLNDRFEVVTQGDVEVLEMRIYNRWGQVVFEGSGANASWDGKHNGKDAPNDVYVYYVVTQEAGEESVVRGGELTLVR